jgi:uroporphyrinogen III methyltransferase/synthase
VSLAGRVVVVTRAAAQAEGLAEALRARGAEPLFIPTIRVAPPEDPGPMVRAAEAIDTYDLVAVGSTNAVDALVAALAGRAWGGPVACVGKKTAQHVRRSPAQAVLTGQVWVPPAFRAEGLAARIAAGFEAQGGLQGRRILYAQAREGRDTLRVALEAAGAVVDVVEAYCLVPESAPSPEDLRALESADAVTFLSGETLAAWFEVVPAPQAVEVLRRAVVAVIGPVAANRAAALGVRVDVVPPEATVEALVEALAVRLGAPPPGSPR